MIIIYVSITLDLYYISKWVISLCCMSSIKFLRNMFLNVKISQQKYVYLS